MRKITDKQRLDWLQKQGEIYQDDGVQIWSVEGPFYDVRKAIDRELKRKPSK